MTDRERADEAFARRMMDEARALRAVAEAAWLPAVRAQLMSRVAEYENAAALSPSNSAPPASAPPSTR